MLRWIPASAGGSDTRKTAAEKFERRYDNMYVLILLAMVLTTAALLETNDPKEGYRDPLWCTMVRNY